MKRFVVLGLVLCTAAACGKKDKDTDTTNSSTLADSSDAGSALKEIDAALKSLSLSTSTTLRVASSTPTLATGVATTYCDGNAEPLKDNAAMSGSDNNFPSAAGYCQATQNTQSPDSTRGALYLAGGIACEVGTANLLKDLTVDQEKTSQVTIDFGTDCWGTEAEAAAFKQDTGADSLSLDIKVTKLADTAAYDYKIAFALGQTQTITLKLKSSDGMRAAHFIEETSDGKTAWAISLNAKELAKTVVSYEKIDEVHSGRSRVLIKGAMKSDFTFESVDSVQGFDARGDNTNSIFTFAGNTTVGFLGGDYSTNGGARDNSGAGFCYLPGKTDATCDGVTFIPSSLAQANALLSASTTARTALASYDTVLELSSIDPTDTDVTQ